MDNVYWYIFLGRINNKLWMIPKYFYIILFYVSTCQLRIWYTDWTACMENAYCFYFYFWKNENKRKEKAKKEGGGEVEVEGKGWDEIKDL